MNRPEYYIEVIKMYDKYDVIMPLEEIGVLSQIHSLY